MYVCVLHAMPGSYGGQKRISDPLELELQVTVSHCVGAGRVASALRH